MYRIRPKISNDVAETLFITLLIRSEETKHPEAIIRDPKAVEFVMCIDYDFFRFSEGKFSRIGAAIRVRHFDNTVMNFIETRPQPVVVLVGCGLDTRYQRLPNRKRAVFYELNLSKVIRLRERLLPAEPNQT
ncbi:class I SAM-dependent methyltransferase [Methanolobus psychrotolerans]|uniref:class I SAM-dependent methyltransferase n=1 Tax=Methanolobus psychrotolerans TaxID=1874706 RepID=UPI000B917449|nr:class I SAM-dependent methyltransferase [Methanolobus psychrotolerans]